MSFTRPAVNLDHRHSRLARYPSKRRSPHRIHPQNFSKVILEPRIHLDRPRAKLGNLAEPPTSFSREEEEEGEGFVIGKRNRGTLTNWRRDIP